jgi:hypothetical protein
MKYLTLYWPAGGSHAEGRNEIIVVSDGRGTPLFFLPSIEVECIGSHSFILNGRTHTTNEYRSLIGGKPSRFIGSMNDAIILGLEEHFGLSARGYRVRMKVAPK